MILADKITEERKKKNGWSQEETSQSVGRIQTGSI